MLIGSFQFVVGDDVKVPQAPRTSTTGTGTTGTTGMAGTTGTVDTMTTGTPNQGTTGISQTTGPVISDDETINNDESNDQVKLLSSVSLIVISLVFAFL